MYLELGVDFPDGGWGVLFPEGTGLWVLGSIFSLLAAGESVAGPWVCLLPVQEESEISMEWSNKKNNKFQRDLSRVLFYS